MGKNIKNYVTIISGAIFLINFLITKNKLEFIQANLAISLALGLNGIITNVLKLCVGMDQFHIFKPNEIV